MRRTTLASIVIVTAGLPVVAAACRGSASAPSPPPLLAGAYELRLELGCEALPTAVRHRLYYATTTPTSPLSLTLSGGTFWQHPSRAVTNRILVHASGENSVGLSVAATPTGGSVAFRFGLVEQIGEQFLELAGAGPGIVENRKLGAGRRAVTGTINLAVRYGSDLRDPSRHVGCTAALPASFTLTPIESAVPDAVISPSLLSVRIDEPADVAPGASAPITLTGTFSDGSTREVRDAAEWRTSDSRVLPISPDGVVSGTITGEATITATVKPPHLPALTTSRTLIVVPSGTFRLSGRVSSAEDPTFGLSLVRVRVTAGLGIGQQTTTTDIGDYRLYGVGGQARIEFDRDGYISHALEVSITGHQTVNAGLRLQNPLDRVDGRYTLRVTSSTGCAGTSVAGISRVYSASLSQVGPRLTTVLSGAEFFSGRSRFQGTVEPERVKLSLSDLQTDHAYYYYYFPDVVEVTSPGAYLVIAGEATLTRTATGLTGLLNGSMRTATLTTPARRLATVADCRASDHRLELIR